MIVSQVFKFDWGALLLRLVCNKTVTGAKRRKQETISSILSSGDETCRTLDGSPRATSFHFPLQWVIFKYGKNFKPTS